ncbi:MAG TPA: adenosylcobinamide-GDP ribazoletransferase [Alphaproteobacteria bacterium]|jgi:adenosylcobinamide-GDP ribazoletransferase|nr:adenosylcobinamide-GDP ribazoletransferase [Alphaproteobacteria bacterium]
MTEPQPQYGDWRRLLDAWREDLLVAVGSQTRIPVKLSFEITAERRARALRAHPIVGLGIGAAGAVAYAVASAFGLPPLPAALLAVGAIVLLTGAAHENGLADVTDGFGGGKTVEHKLEIMRDNRAGTSGVIALALSVALRAASLASLAEPGLVALALLAAGAVSRGFVPAVMRMLEPVGGEGGTGVGVPSAETTVLAAAIGAAAALICLGLAPGGAAFVASAGAVIVMAAIAFRQIGGYTDDVLGACQQVGEVVLLLGAAAHAGT